MAAKHWKADDLVIEIDAPQAERYDFPPARNHPDDQKFLRSAYSLRKLPPGMGNKTGMMRLPEIPGQHVILDIKGSRGGLIDPLNWKENEKLLDQIRAVCKGSSGVRIGDIRPIRDLTWELPPERIASWLYHMRAAIAEYEVVKEEGEIGEVQKCRSARVIQGALLMATNEQVAEAIPNWYDTIVERSTDPTRPRTIREMEIWRRGDWARFKLGPGAYHEVAQ